MLGSDNGDGDLGFFFYLLEWGSATGNRLLEIGFGGGFGAAAGGSGLG